MENYQLTKKFWSGACDQQSNLGRPLFMIFFFISFFLLLPAVTILPEGDVIGFRNLAWAANSQNIRIPTNH